MTHMQNDDRTENRLRELLRDARWSLPSWPDAEARVRKEARRQRLRAAGVAAGAGVAAITAIAVPLTVPGTPPPGPVAAGAVVLLTCQNSAGQQGRDTSPARLVHGVDGFIGDTNAYDTLPVQQLDGHRYLAWETALSVAPDAGPYRTVSVVTPASARLSYGSGIAGSSRSVRLPACGHRYALYIGGILVRRPACITLAVSGPSGKQTTVAVPVLRSCPPRAR
jgi:hypothetical protein